MAEKETINQHPNFLAERPIKFRKEDKLGRRPFAEAIAQAISQWRGQDSLTIGIYGPWGCGKTSIKNMVKEYLSDLSLEDRPKVLDFSPWEFSGSKRLLEEFFKEIGRALGVGDKVKKNKDLSKKWEAYAKKAAIVSSAVGEPGSSGYPMVVLGSIGIIFSRTDVIPSETINDILMYASFFLTAVGVAFKWVSGISNTVTSYLKIKSGHLEKSLKELKDELSDLLSKRSQPLLVVIDDIDRLDKSEIGLILKLVRSHADFPGLIYLLLFQREKVEKSLEEIDPLSGRKFLEKIIQVAFDVPAVERKKLEGVLTEGLDNVIAFAGDKSNFDQNRWYKLYFSGLKYYFNNLRDTYRYLSTLKFHVAQFKTGRILEVNIVDLIALETLRLFEPDVYHQLPLQKEIFTKSHDREARPESKKIVDGIIERGPLVHKEHILKILQELFPHIVCLYEGTSFVDFDVKWAQELRVCSKDSFDRYFQMSIPEGELPRAELEEIIGLSKNHEQLVEKLKNLNGRGLLADTLYQLDDYRNKFNSEEAPSVIAALFDIGDDLPEEGKMNTWFNFSPAHHADRIIYSILKNIETQTQREEILEKALKETKGIYLPALEIHYLQKKPKNSGESEILITQEKIEEFKRIVVEKIKATRDSLPENKQLSFLLYIWNEWEGIAGPKEFVGQLIDKPKGVLKFLKPFVGKTRSSTSGEYRVRIEYYIKLGDIEKFLTLDTIKEKISQLDTSKLNQMEKECIEAFNKALERREKGEPDNPMHRFKEAAGDS